MNNSNDWHPADIKAKLAKRGHSLSSIARSCDISPMLLSRTFTLPSPKNEQRIAVALGVKPQDIWPSRYDKSGVPNRKRGKYDDQPATAQMLALKKHGANSSHRRAA